MGTDEAEDLISVIVPVYNVEKYLKRCLNSIRNQTYRNLEIILVDDGSTDRSPRICDRYAEKDKRFRVFHIKNGGVARARNFGLKQAGGVYLTFVDSDDWLPVKGIEILYNKIKSSDSDLCCGNYIRVLVSGAKINQFYGNSDFSVKNLILLSDFIGGALPCWATLFRRNCIKSDFPIDILLHEDTYFVSEFLFHCDKVASVEEGVYYYNHLNNISLSRKRYESINLYNSKPLELRSNLFGWVLPRKQQEIIVRTFVGTLIHYIENFCYQEAIEKIGETYSIFRRYLDMVNIDASQTKDGVVIQYLSYLCDLQEGNYEKIYFKLKSHKHKSKLKAGLRRMILPFIQFFVFKLQLGYKK